MLTLSNGLSFIRAPMAILFLQESIPLRLFAIFVAMLTDSIDGYVARKSKSVSKFGAILDPSMDKFFVYFVLGILSLEGQIHLLEILAMLSRDIFLCIFALYLCIAKKWTSYQFRAIRWGKITTAMQFIVLVGLTLGYSLPPYIYSLFIAMGALAFVELLQTTTVPRKS